MNNLIKLSLYFGGIIPDALISHIFGSLNFAQMQRIKLCIGRVENKALPLVQWPLSWSLEIFYYLQRFLKAANRPLTKDPSVRKKYRPGDVVPESGIYRVTHDSHRLMHEATLLEGQRFPICRKCKHDVRFELRRAVKNPTRIISGYHAILEDYPDVEPYIVN